MRFIFGSKVGDQDKSWAPRTCCLTCVRFLTFWVHGSRQMLFAVPVVWREPKDHSSEFYSSLTNITRIASKFKHTVKYQALLSAIRPVPHSEE